MTDFKFRKDRKLFLSNCSIHPSYPPAVVFLNSQFPYETLTISKSALKWLSYDTDALPFFEFLGESVTKLRLVDFGVDKETCQVFKAFPLLERLRMDGYETFFKVKDLMEVDCLDLFPSLKSLKVRNLLSIDRLFDLMKVVPKLKSLNFQDFDNLESRHYRNMIKFNKEHPGLLQTIYVPMFQEKRDDGVQKSEIIDCVKSNSSIRRVIHKLQAQGRLTGLQDVIREQSSIKEIFLYCVEPPPVTMSNLTVLEMKLSSDVVQDMSTLEPLINLKSLVLDVKEARCCFGHQPLSLPRLKIFKLSVWNSNCTECYLAISGSFPHLREFHLLTLSNMTPRGQIQYFFGSWAFLTKLSIRHSTNSVGIPLVNELTKLIVCHKLTHLALGNNIVINGDAIKKLCGVCPNLVTLKFYMESTSPPINRIIEGLLTALPGLTTLLIHPSEVSFYSVTEEEASQLFGIIIKHGKKLRVSLNSKLTGYICSAFRR